MITEELPLSYAQQRLWFLDQLEPNSSTYNIPLALRLAGNLNRAALEQSLQEIIDRHEALRTNFVTVDEQPIQIIHTQTNWKVSVLEWQNLSPSEQEIATQQLVQQQAIQPFDLAKGALIRATLVVLSQTENILLVCMHHVVSDGWSMGVFVSELATLYKAYSQGQPSPLAPLPIQYADFALWQKDWLQGDVLQTQLNYWQQQLKDAPALLPLPTDRPRPAVQTFTGATQEFTLSVELTNRLTKLSQERGCTLFMTLLTAFDILLYRYTGQSDILVGTPIANRDRSEIEGLIGFFVNTLVMRTSLADNPTFSELLGRVREIALGAYNHQDLPFEMLVEALQPERNLSHTPLFQVMFALQNAPMSELELAGLTISPLTAQSTTTKFDLSLSMYNSGAGLVGVWEYSTDLFDASTIERITGHFVNLLSGIVANSKERISQLPMLTQVEQQQLLVEWNDTQVDYPFDKCIHQLFEEQVERTPNAVAVIFDNQQLTYQQLNCRANQLAHYLQSLGVTADTLVGICVERSLEMVVGLLGILKAGGAYVPLDPDYPQERLSFMLEDAQVKVLLTQQQVVEKLPQHQAQVVCLDTEWEFISQSSQDNAIAQLTVDIASVQATNLAYVIYTSGSTGKPKGVMIPHGAIANHCCIIQQAYALRKSDRVLQFASINFDASLEQILPTLIVGATLVLRGSDVWTPTNFQKIVSDFELTVVNLPTAYWQQLTQEWVKTQVLDTNSKLRLVIVGGDVMLPEYVAIWQQSPMSGVRLINAYGPTETTITATLFEILPQLSQDINLKKIPIGRPLPNRTVYITAYQQLAQGKAIKLPTKTTSFKDWSNKLTEYAQSQVLKSEVAYWLNESRIAVPSIPVDYTQRANTVEGASTVSVSLSEAQTRALLQDVPKAYNTQINDVLLTALVLVLSRWTNSNCVLFNLEGHGREDIIDGVDLSRTIGWFTTIFPVVLELGVTENLADALKSVKEQLRVISNKGIGYGLLRYLSQDVEIAAQLQALPHAEISFNYLGQFDQLLNTSSWIQPASEAAGHSQSLQNNRAHLLDINSIITGDRLQIEWIYSTNVHQQTTIASLAQEFVETLQGLIAHCSSGESGGYTPSDFPLTKLKQLELDQLLASLGKTNSKNIEDIYPLSPMQQGMLFESLYAPNTGVYFEQLSFTLKSELNVAAFEQAWQQVVARHSILRTAFVWQQLAQPLQVVYRQLEINLNRHDWQQLSSQEQQQQLELFLQSQRQQGFQLNQAPLMYLGLIQLSADSYQFVWSSHHLLLDGWSMPLVFKDLLYFYQAISQGETVAVQPAQNYRNYIAWLQKQDLTQAEQFWREKLQGFTSPTSLTVDKPSSKRQQLNSSYSEQQIQLTEQATAALQTFARQHQLTINNLVQATWALLLSRYNQEKDVVFGATVSGRPPSLIGIESMVGIFINTLPVRVQVGDDTQVWTLLKDLQTQQVESEQYSYNSLVDIQGWSEVSRGTPLFESIVVFENYPVDEAVQSHNHSFSIESIHSIEQTNYPLTVIAAPGKQLLMKINYDTSRFDDGAIARLLCHFQTLLEGIIANPQQQIAHLPLITPREQHQLLAEWNDTQTDDPIDKCIHQLFEEQVERTPDAVAVEFENQQLTYHELNCRANQLAHYLKSLGVKPDVLVGLCVERSLEMVVGLLGILKAGGAYVPLDPDYPIERLHFMLEDTQVKVLLTQKQLISKLPEHQGKLHFGLPRLRSAQVAQYKVCLDTDWAVISQWSQENLVTHVEASNLVYVIFTSGSTGKPKGVALPNRAITNLIQWHLATLQTGVGVLQFASLSFDASIHEMFAAWCSGGTLFIVTEAVRLDLDSLIHFLASKPIQKVILPVVVLQQLAEVYAQQKHLFKNLTEIITTGEQLQVNRPIVNLFNNLENCSLHNHYGPSETHVVTAFTFSGTPNTWPAYPPIGKPIDNTQMYIVDSNFQPVPIGVTGELYIGGVGLANGYFNRPELTKQKFIPNPFGRSRGDREGQFSHSEFLYKTGDLARYLPDGNIEFLGRIDHQVKIRGFRVEPGEIETVLNQHPEIQTTVAIVREDTPGDKRLVAYVVPHEQCVPTLSQLRQFLKAKLPAYMIPVIVILDSLPLTPNGKVDRRALQEPSDSSDADKFVAPRSQVELQLTQIWSRILKVDRVGVQDNFFDLGGHSLLTPYLMAQIKQQFGKDIAIASLYQNPTVEQLATVIQADSNFLTKSPLVAIQSHGSKPPLFCLPGAAGDPFYLYNLARCLGSDQPFYSFQADALCKGDEPITSVEDVATQYIQALLAIQPQGPYFLAGHSFGGKLAFEIAQQLLDKGHKVALVAILDTKAPFYQEKPMGFDWDNGKWLFEFARAIEVVYAKNLNISIDTLESLVWEDQLKYVLERLKDADILPPDDEITKLNNKVQFLKTNCLVSYVPQQFYSSRITLLRASETAAVDESNSEVPAEILQDLTWGWGNFSDEPVDVHFIPGNHVTMINQPHVQILAERLKACIEQAQKATDDEV
ncbi:MAG: amino acid adenylation domain-containing protein [Nostoc sp. DedQUE08]|uniref:non-ribosomal peptide synthetase n=1 Tax=Nostoc sp. DedQUE08 TaxID=3075393 RepID=UPI002AD1F04B|nr:non-ribosomal peptide synthetase [Nostoc sp. DedQUE08]MDZ8065210.1 amino acid adenylation domain-containing protein [Nostoc sp. DedQUE08]